MKRGRRKRKNALQRVLEDDMPTHSRVQAAGLTRNHNDEVKNIPAVHKVLLWIQNRNLDCCFQRKCAEESDIGVFQACKTIKSPEEQIKYLVHTFPSIALTDPYARERVRVNY